MASSPADKDDDPISQALELELLDFESLFNALTAVEHAVPEMLLAVKPVLAHLANPSTSFESAEAGVERYIDLLDKIQFVLRQAIYYLRETKASTSALNPPPVNAIPTPFASSLPLSVRAAMQQQQQQDEQQEQSESGEGSTLTTRGGSGPSGESSSRAAEAVKAFGDQQGDDEDYTPELGLYGLRVEAKTLKDIAALLERMRSRRRDAEEPGDGAAEPPEGDMPVDHGAYA